MPRNKVYEKGFKAFNKGMTCLGKQYKENTLYYLKDGEFTEVK